MVLLFLLWTGVLIGAGMRKKWAQWAGLGTLGVTVLFLLGNL